MISGTFNSSGSKSGLKEEIILENKEDPSALCSNSSIICKHIIDFFHVYIDKLLQTISKQNSNT